MIKTKPMEFGRFLRWKLMSKLYSSSDSWHRMVGKDFGGLLGATIRCGFRLTTTWDRITCDVRLVEYKIL